MDLELTGINNGCGVYFIQNTATGKLYVGSSKTIRSRLFQHFSYLRKGNHHSRKLQNSFNKHREDAFDVGIIQECSELNLMVQEQFWINFYDSYHGGYNGRPKAESTRGLPATEQRKRLVTESCKLTWKSEGLRSALSDRFKGIVRGKRNPLTGQKQSDSLKNFYRSNKKAPTPIYSDTLQKRSDSMKRTLQLKRSKLTPQTIAE